MQDSEAKEVHERLLALYATQDQLLDNHAMLMSGVQTVVDANAAINDRLDGVVRDASDTRSDMRWVRALLFLLLLWQVGSAVYTTAPAQAMVATVWP